MKGLFAIWALSMWAMLFIVTYGFNWGHAERTMVLFAAVICTVGYFLSKYPDK